MNNKIFFDLYSLAHQSTFLDGLIIFFAKYFPFLVLIFAIFFLLLHHEVLTFKNQFKNFTKRWREIFFVSFSVIFAWVSSLVLKLIFQVPRPFIKFSNINPLITPMDYSFPSGHSAFFMAIAVAIFLCHKRVGYIFIICAILIGLSRIVAGIHFPLDVFVGWILGGSISFLFIKIFKKI